MHLIRSQNSQERGISLRLGNGMLTRRCRGLGFWNRRGRIVLGEIKVFNVIGGAVGVDNGCSVGIDISGVGRQWLRLRLEQAVYSGFARWLGW